MNFISEFLYSPEYLACLYLVANTRAVIKQCK